MTTQMNLADSALLTLVAGPDVVTHATKPRALDRLPTTFVQVEANRAVLEKLGFTIGEVSDDLFTEVTAPAGWGLISTDHYMYSHAVDGQGRVRGQLGYKGSWHDRWASFYFLTRYTIDEVRPENWFQLHCPPTLTEKVKRKVLVEPKRGEINDYDFDEGANEWTSAGYGRYDSYGRTMRPLGYKPAPQYEMRTVEVALPDDQQPKPQGYLSGFGVKDRVTDSFLFKSDQYMCEPRAYRDHEIAEVPLRAQVKAWLDETYPDHRDVSAYW